MRQSNFIILSWAYKGTSSQKDTNRKRIQLISYRAYIKMMEIIVNLLLDLTTKINVTQINKMSFFGVQLNAQVNRLQLEIRLKLSQNKFSPNFRTIYRSMAKYDPEISGNMNAVHFQKALNENGLFFKKFQIQAFAKAYQNEQGSVSWFTFMGHLREPMGPVRRQLVENIYDNICKNHDQKVTPNILMDHFNPSQIQGYKKGIQSLQTIQNDMLSMFSMPEGCLSREEFIAYYDDVSINFPHNDVFIRYVSQMWNFTPQKIQECKEEEIKGALKQFRFKLIQRSQGTKDEYLLRKLFEEFDVNKNSSIGTYELDLMLKKIGTPVQARLVGPMLVKLDKNCSGFIEYEEFKKFVFFDPYPI